MPRELQGASIPSLILNIEDNRPLMWCGFFQQLQQAKNIPFFASLMHSKYQYHGYLSSFYQGQKIIHQRHITYNGARRNVLK